MHAGQPNSHLQPCRCKIQLKGALQNKARAQHEKHYPNTVAIQVVYERATCCTVEGKEGQKETKRGAYQRMRYFIQLKHRICPCLTT